MTDVSKFLEEDAEGYSIQVVGHNVLVTEAMKNYAWDKMAKIERFGVPIMHVHIVLDIQKLEHGCTIVVKFAHFPLKVHAGSTDMYASIDKAIERLQTQLRRWKGKIEDHHKKKLSSVDVDINLFAHPHSELEEINEEIEAKKREEQERKFQPPKLVGRERMPLKTLTTDEALMKIDLMDELFLIYRDEADRKLKVIYRRPDGKYGVVQPE